MTDQPENQAAESASPAMTVAEADAALTGPGGFFEIVTDNVGGIEMGVVAGPHQSLRDLLAASAGHGGDGSARYYLFDDGRSATFAENIGHAAAVAAALTQRYGVGPGDRVGLLGANQPGWIQAFWGTVSAGAVAVAMNGWWKGAEIRHGIDLTGPKVLVADRRRLERLDGDPGVPVIAMDPDPDAAATIDSLVGTFAGSPLPDCPTAIDDPAAILFTSGTTGRPRGAIQTQRNFLAYLNCAYMIGGRQFLRFPGETIDAGGPTLACSPLFHVSGLHACAVTAVGAGAGHLWTTGRYDPEKILRLTEEHGIARWSGVTTQLWRLVEHPRLADYDTSSVVGVGGGGSLWSPELQQKCRTALPHARISVSVGYGLTESSGLATSAADDVLRAHPDSVGYPLPTVGVRITDDDGRELPDGEAGNICLSGPMVTPGYWNDPAATAETIRDGWLRTGDYGYLRDGLLFLVSRRSDLIIRGGENIYPAEIEQRLDAHPAVAESAVLGVEHRELGQEVKAVAVVDGDRPASDLIAELEAWVAGTLADIKVPAHWELRTEPLPRNATGKILKQIVQGDADYDFIEE
ncbi:MAG: class I adenylate-forming enzyme family protein [Acidimicrobiaceae bacterium]|nr:class I adenylate-forming enzyme family protein [Acidimicrobiaceae bacterium]